MQLVPNSLFAFPQMQHLLDAQARVVDRHARGMASGQILSIAPLPSQHRAPAGTRQPISRLHVVGEKLEGDQRCAADALPWPSASFQLVVARHVVDALPPDSGIEKELGRVLAPGGVLLMTGLNPLSPWRFWWSRRWRDGVRMPVICSPAHMLCKLEDHGLSLLDRQFVGGAWPRRAAVIDDIDGPGSRWDGAWVLVTQKQSAAVRPIRLRARAPQARFEHAWAPSSRGRLCA